MTYDRTRADIGLFAARSGERRLRLAGCALAVAGLVMVIFSFFTWTAASDDGLSISVTGMGAVTLEISEERAAALGGADEAAAELDKRSNSPGVVTAALGALIVVGGAMVLINRYPGIGALAGAVPALIGLFMSLEYLFAPGAAVLEGTGDAGIGFAAIGLWLVTASAAVAVPVSFYAVVVALRATRQPLAHKNSGASRPARRSSVKAPVHAGPRTTAPRYLDRVPAAPRPRPHHTHGPRPEPGYRARPVEVTDRMGRRPSENLLPHPPSVPGAGTRKAASYRPPPGGRPRSNHSVPHGDPAVLPPVRRATPSPGADRGLPPMPRSRRSSPPSGNGQPRAPHTGATDRERW